MKEKGVIREIIPWVDARKKLFWRLRRRILVNELSKKVLINSLNESNHGWPK